MSDLERLDEALERLDRPTRNLADVFVDAMKGNDPSADADWHQFCDDLEEAVAAARAYRDLLANGERIWWCDEHQLSELSGGRCATAWLPDGPRTPCRMVPKLLVDPPTEEEE